MMRSRRNAKNKRPGDTAGDIKSTAANDVGSDTEEMPGADSEDFETFVRNTLTQIMDGQRQLEENLARSIEFNSERIAVLEGSSKSHGKDLKNLKEDVASLNEKLARQQEDINKQERYSRRNNFRIVGVNKQDQENCVDIVRGMFADIDKFDWEEPLPKIERAHRDGRGQDGRSPHILVKMLSYQDKIRVMKSAKQGLDKSPWFIVDDLTLTDLKEKKKWKEQVTELYESGTKLKFVAGKWRRKDGAVYQF